MRKKGSSWSWRITAGLALIGAVVLGGGAIVAIVGPTGDASATQAAVEAQSTPAVTAVDQQNQPYLIVALGDSLTKGIGDLSGKGYIGYVQDKLQAGGQQVTLQNFGISGLESGELLKSLQGAGHQDLIKQAKLIAISIGANDMSHSIGNVSNLFDGKGVDLNKIAEAEKQSIVNLEQILQIVRANNEQAPVVLIGLYNPFEGMFEPEMNAALSNQLISWNTNISQTVQKFSNVKVVPTYDIFQWNNNELLSVDHFHPNQAGYEKMADRIIQVLPGESEKK